MFFEVYGANALAQWGMLLVVLVGLILFNEFARRTKLGGAITFFAIPLALTIYFIAIAVGARMGAEWALTNQTHLYMNGWFHYAKLYAALTGCIGFMMIKYEWGIGAKRWFKPFPFIIVAINILMAQCLQWSCRSVQHLLYDRMVECVSVQGQERYDLGGHDLGLYPRL